MKKSGAIPGQSASELISQRIAELGDWRVETLGRMRTLIKAADPDVVEEWKWMGHYGLVARRHHRLERHRLDSTVQGLWMRARTA